LANIVGDVDSLHVEIDNLNALLVGVCFIRSIDKRKLFYALYHLSSLRKLISS
jgi:hypothetical protein